MSARVYLDWNATAPLRPEARAAMLEAMDLLGNPSSVHAEGRAARAIVERARVEVAALAGADPSEVVFTSGATEGVATVARQGWDLAVLTGLEHDAVHCALAPALNDAVAQALVCHGPPGNDARPGGPFWEDEVWEELAARRDPACVLLAVTAADGETGITGLIEDVLHPLADHAAIRMPRARIVRFSDLTQRLGKAPVDVAASGLDLAVAGAHKIGGPKGVGCLIARRPEDLSPLLLGGGQEGMRRAGTENLVAIAGFGAAAAAARRDLGAGAWERAAELRNLLERSLAEQIAETMFFGQECARLPNTSCFAAPGWSAEMQVMQMDLDGFAISAGSACSSGKIRASRVLDALGAGDMAGSAVRVSLGPSTTDSEILAFAESWVARYRRRRARAA